jgi:hypothetical protein
MLSHEAQEVGRNVRKMRWAETCLPSIFADRGRDEVWYNLCVG